MSNARTRPRQPGDIRCPECDAVVEDRDELADHLTEVHDAFDWLMKGRPVGFKEAGGQ
ncbi:hypothetical protein [Halococcus sediminicola]|uniref:hypothetical protein n=1 Tax=Halococcus sediminicola TaxID=1264579 RepID=UPI000AD0630A|nr:hypothetical protein [Halococcus sediminicola]